MVVLSHALALDRSMWSVVAAGLACGYTVVSYDHRGHGDGKQAAESFDIDNLADDAADLIREVSDDPVVFVGLSLGGMVGQALAARHPSLLRGLAVLNSAAHYPDRTIWDTRIKAVREGGMKSIVEGSIDRWLTPTFRQSPAGQEVAQRLRTVLLRTDAHAYASTCDAIARMDLRDGNRRIKVPTLVIAGRQDLATPLGMSQGIVSDILNAGLAEIDAAHVSAAEAPEEIVELLSRWMQTLSS